MERSYVPACRNAVDMTVEQTINRSAKTAGGIVRFSRIENVYYFWSLATLSQLNMTSYEADSHKSSRPSEIKHSEEDVSKLL